jgi:hypothetical protein
VCVWNEVWRGDREGEGRDEEEEGYSYQKQLEKMLRRRIHACHMRRRIDACHMRRRRVIHGKRSWRRCFVGSLQGLWFDGVCVANVLLVCC